jgi:hypothetical protein
VRCLAHIFEQTSQTQQLGPSFNQTAVHPENSQREKDKTKNQQIGQVPKQVGPDQAKAERPCEFH